MEDGGASLGYIHFPFIVLQVIFLFGMSWYKKRYPEQFEEMLHKYFFLPSKVFREQKTLLPADMQIALADAYQHPWYKLKSQVTLLDERQKLTKYI